LPDLNNYIQKSVAFYDDFIKPVVTSKSYVQFNRCDIYYVNQKNEIKKIPRKRRKNITPMATSIII